MENKVYAISKCCNSHTWSLPQTLHSMMLFEPRVYICMGCGECCDIEEKPAYLEKSKGVYEKLTYNKEPLYDENGNGLADKIDKFKNKL